MIKVINMKKITKEEYSKLTEKISPPSPTLKNCVFAFLIGGLICTVGQIFLDTYLSFGFSKEEAGMLNTITMIFIGVTLTAFGIYEKIGSKVGAGTLVPITGFANSVASSAIEFRTEGFITGVGVKMFVIAGPVIVYSIAAGVVYGVVVFLMKIITKA